MAGLQGFLISAELLLKMFLVGCGITVEVATLVVILLLDVQEGGGALGNLLEAGESWNVTVSVDVHVLDGWRLHDIKISLLIVDFLVEHLELLLVLLDTHLNAVDQDLGVDCLLVREGDRGLLVAEASDGDGRRCLWHWLLYYLLWNKCDRLWVQRNLLDRRLLDNGDRFSSGHWGLLSSAVQL